MRRSAENNIPLVGNLDRGVDQRLVTMGQSNLQTYAIILELLGSDRQRASTGDFKRPAAVPRDVLAVLFECSVGTVLQGFELLLHAFELGIELIALIACQDGSDRHLYGLRSLVRAGQPACDR